MDDDGRSTQGWLGRWWASAGWVLAAAVSGASLWFPVFVLRAPLVSALDPSEAASYAVTTFDPWGGSTTMVTGLGAVFDVPGGPNYAVAVIPCAVLLLAAAAARFTAARRSWAAIVSTVVAPVAAGALGAIAGCQLLAYLAMTRLSPPGGLYGGGETRAEGELGWSPWLLAAGALLAVTVGVRLRLAVRSAPAAAAPQPPAPQPPAGQPPAAPPERAPDPAPPPASRPEIVPEVDPAIFRRPRRPDRG